MLSGSWQTWTANNSGEYWDNTSSDTGYGNVGYILSGLGLDGSTDYYWAGSGGTADTDITFTGNGTSQASIIIEVADWAGTNVFGWYEIDTSGNIIILHELFAGIASAGATATFTSYFHVWLLLYSKWRDILYRFRVKFTQ